MNVVELQAYSKPLTRRELAEELGVSMKTIQRWDALGLPSERWGRRLRRYVLSEVRAWLREGGGNGS